MDLHSRQEALRTDKVPAVVSKNLSDHDMVRADVSKNFHNLPKSLGSAGEGAAGFETIKNYTQNLVVKNALPNTTISCEKSTKTEESRNQISSAGKAHSFVRNTLCK